MKKVMLLLALLMSGFGFCATQITDLTVTPISSFGQVIVEFNVEGDAVPSEHPWWLTCTEVDSGKAYRTTQVATVTDGRYRLEWDMAADSIRLDNKAVIFKVEHPATYLVIDLSGGTSATSYPVTALAAPPEGGWTDEYKTTKLVLRVIESGSYKMNGSYDVTISQPFYMGVFEVTQKQYQLVTGSNPASYKGDARPVEYVSWNTIRGNSSTHNWPSVKTVDANSFMGKIRTKTGLTFDLPTEAQWEYACRAGTTSKYNNGGDTEADLKTLGRYTSNGGASNKHANVGSYLPNAWGLYDMYGNVYECCLDWYGSLSSSTDPKGPTSGSYGSYRVFRGGSWYSDAGSCTSSYRHPDNPSRADGDLGFRLACPAGEFVDLAEESERMTISTYIAAMETVDGIEWSYEVTKNGEAKIYKEVGESAIPNTTTGAITIPSSLGGYPVTAIGDNAFKDCSALTSVTIPEGEISIGSDVFDGCSSITKVKLPLLKALKGAFYEACFTDKQAIETERSIKDNVVRVCESAAMLYADTTNEYTTYAYGTNMYFEGGATYHFSVKYDDKAFVKVDDSVVIAPHPSDIQTQTGSIQFETSGWHWLELRGYNHGGPGATNNGTNSSFLWWTSVDATKRRFTAEDGKDIFSVSATLTLSDVFGDLCANLQDVELVGNWDKIPGSYYADCTGLTSVAIPNGVTSIGASAFNGCSNLISVTIPSSVTSIGNEAFNGCLSLTSVAIPSSVTSIGGSAFKDCTGLTSVTIPEGVALIGASAFNGCTALTSVTIPSSATSIGASAFNGCSSLTSVTILSSVTSIGNNAFANTGSLSPLVAASIPSGVSKEKIKDLIIPEGVTSIASDAFKGCNNLTSVVIPSSVTSIGSRAFASSNETLGALKKTTFLGAVPTFGERVGINGDIYYPRSHKVEWENLRMSYIHSSNYIIDGRTNWYCMGGAVKVLSILSTGVAEVKSDFYLPNETVTITATPKEGYVFLGWSSDVAGISGVDSTLTFTMPEQEEVILVANFFPKALLEGWMDARIDAKVDGETLLTAKQASAATEASISQKVADGELLTPAGAATQTEKVINQKVADGELITSDQLQVMAMEAPVIAVEDGVAKVGVSLKRAASLEGEWEQVEAEEAEITDEGAISVSVPAGEKAGFYKFVVPNQQ